MQELPPGAMLAVRATRGEVGPLLGRGPRRSRRFNAPKLIVVSGGPRPSSAAGGRAREPGRGGRGARHLARVPLADDGADPRALRRGRRARCRVSAPQTPFVSSRHRRLDHRRAGDGSRVLGAPAPRARPLRGRRAPLRSIDPSRVYLEVGPGPDADRARATAPAGSRATSCDRLARRLGRRARTTCVAARGGRSALDARARILDWTGVHGNVPRRRVPLPTYPFERKRYWVDPAAVEPREPVSASDARQCVRAICGERTDDLDDDGRRAHHERGVADGGRRARPSARTHGQAADALLGAVRDGRVGAASRSCPSSSWASTRSSSRRRARPSRRRSA